MKFADFSDDISIDYMFIYSRYLMIVKYISNYCNSLARIACHVWAKVNSFEHTDGEHAAGRIKVKPYLYVHEHIYI